MTEGQCLTASMGPGAAPVSRAPTRLSHNRHRWVLAPAPFLPLSRPPDDCPSHPAGHEAVQPAAGLWRVGERWLALWLAGWAGWAVGWAGGTGRVVGGVGSGVGEGGVHTGCFAHAPPARVVGAQHHSSHRLHPGQTVTYKGLGRSAVALLLSVFVLRCRSLPWGSAPCSSCW